MREAEIFKINNENWIISDFEKEHILIFNLIMTNELYFFI